MSLHTSNSATAFAGNQLLQSGSLLEVALAMKAASLRHPETRLLAFDDRNGRVLDVDLRGSDQDIAARLAGPGEQSVSAEPPQEPRGRGRPKLGVIAREVTLLPRQWEWLASQPGGASAALRRLVEEARRAGKPRQERREAQEAAYHFMLAMAGDLPGYEEATRALFADDRPALEARIDTWPADIRAHALHMAFGSREHPPGG